MVHAIKALKMVEDSSLSEDDKREFREEFERIVRDEARKEVWHDRIFVVLIVTALLFVTVAFVLSTVTLLGKVFG